MRALLLLAPMLLLGACEPGDVPVRNEGTPGGAGVEWQGVFAASPELCEGGQWRIGERRIETDGEMVCDIGQIEQSPERVELTLQCTAEGMENGEIWQLAPHGDRGLSVHRDAGLDIYEIDLIRCS